MPEIDTREQSQNNTSGPHVRKSGRLFRSAPAARWRRPTERSAPHARQSLSPNAPHSLVITRVIQYSSGVSDKLTGRGVLDRPVKPDDDG
jgi:hypothetical protein